MTIIPRCDLCGRPALEKIYAVPTTRRGLSVCVCGHCGLVQSWPRIASIDSDYKRSLSHGADWGNIRYGKSFVAYDSLDFIAHSAQLWSLKGTILDIGYSRGAFHGVLTAKGWQGEYMACEPDANIDVPDWVSRERVEDMELCAESSEFAYLAHTFEHLESPRLVLLKLQAALRPGGHIYIEVPNLEYIARDDIYEEWFIDKHLTHFAPLDLRRYARCAGLELSRMAAEGEVIRALLRKPVTDMATNDRRFENKLAVAKAKKLVRDYAARMDENMATLRELARVVNIRAESERVAIWGAGRILSALVSVGLDVSIMAAVVDRYLWLLYPNVDSQPIREPSELEQINPDLVLIASREYKQEIIDEIGGRWEYMTV